MKANFQFQNLCGTVYRQGNIAFTPDGNSVFSPVGNRVSVFDLVKWAYFVSREESEADRCSNKSRTLPFENRKNIACIALSPDGQLLLSIDEDGRAFLVVVRKGTVVHRISFKSPVRHACFSPDGKYIAVAVGRKVQVWNTPSLVVREFAPFVLHREYTGHQDEVLWIEWSKTSR